jgi:Ig domain of plant-specific actin-binding protein
MRERPAPATNGPQSRGPRRLSAGYVLSAALVAVVSLVSTAALSSGSAQARGQATPPQSTAPPTVSGSASAGSTLSATSGSWSGDTPITFAYQWRRCDSNGANCSSISGANSSTYTVASAEVGSRLRARVTATNGAGQASVDSASTGVVTPTTSPKNTTEPVITGSTVVGQTLTGTNGGWSGTGPITYSYQWVRCPSDGGAADGGNCPSISGATNTTYTLQSAEVGKRLRLRVKASNSAGSRTAASNATGTITSTSSNGPTNKKEPTISGQSTQGSTLTTSTGKWNGQTPITFGYQWVRCGSDGGKSDGSNCAVISGAAGSSYTLQGDDVGKRLRSRVTATNSGGSSAAASNPTGTVKASSQLPPGAIRLPNGQISIPVTSVSLPVQLIIDRVEFTPNPVRSRRDPILIRVHINDSRGYVVRDAIVFLRSVPLLTSTPQEQKTGQDGWLTLQVLPHADFPVKAGYNVQFFVRARKDGDNPLAGVSARRLVQVATSR